MISHFENKLIDTDYSNIVKGGGYPSWQSLFVAHKPKGILERIFGDLFASDVAAQTPIQKNTIDSTKKIDPSKPLDQQVKDILLLSDKDYSDDLLSSDLRKYIDDVEKGFVAAMSTYKTHIAPSFREVKPGYFNVSGMYGKSYYTHNYPAYIDFLWTRDMMTFYNKRDMSWYIYPSDDSSIQAEMKRRATQLKAEINDMLSKGITIDADAEIEYKDVESIRQKLVTKEERYFQTAYYINIYHNDLEKLAEECKKFEQRIGGFGMGIKQATQRMDESMESVSPLCLDQLAIYRSAVSSSLAGSFPFVSSDLISDTGILYGANLHTGGLIIFDRFDHKLPNANSVILATSGAGKSFEVKLEILRYLLHGIDIIVIDPENEYRSLIDKVGGTYINIAVNSNQYINPFDLPPRVEDVEYGKGDLLRSQIMSLIGLISTLVGGLSAEEEAIMDKALQSTYQLKGYTLDMNDYMGKQPPTMQDLLSILEGMLGAETMALKVSKYVTGTFAKVFNNNTNVDLSSGLTIFSIRDLDDALKTPAMYNILNYIWTKVRSNKKKRLLVVDEAWIMLQKDVSANFLYGIVKRARKYGLGVTTISQDVEDFLKSEFGKPIVTNSAMQILLRQSTASIKSLESVFGLSEAEKQRLVSANIGEGLIFAGGQHVAVKIIASPYEKDFIQTGL